MSNVFNKLVSKTTGRNRTTIPTSPKQHPQRSYPGTSSSTSSSMNRMTSELHLLRAESTRSGYDNSDITEDDAAAVLASSDESPRSVGGNSAEELFQRHRHHNNGGGSNQKLFVNGYDSTEEAMMLDRESHPSRTATTPINTTSKSGGNSSNTARSSNDGGSRNSSRGSTNYSRGVDSKQSAQQKSRNSNNNNNNSTSSVAAFIISETSAHDFSESGRNYIDDYDNEDNDRQQQTRKSSSQLQASDYSFSNGSFDDPIQISPVAMKGGGRGDLTRNRSRSVQRSSTIEKSSTTEEYPGRHSSSRRSKSTGRGQHEEDGKYNFGTTFESSNLSPSHTEEPKRKSKMEKIFQLQEKNQRYKDEFRKVQKDRKLLKMEIEQKRNENATLTKQVDVYLMEISTLKQKLTSTKQTIDRNELNDRKDKSLILKLQKELATVQTDHSIAIGRVTRLREELEIMKLLLCEKDDKIKSLSEEVSEQLTVVDALHLEIMELKQHQSNDTNVDELKEENDRLQTELGETLDRASSMVKEREDAIADLLRDNEDLKRMLTESEAAKEEAVVATAAAVASAAKATAEAEATRRNQRNVMDDERKIEEEKNQIQSALDEITQLREELSLSATALEEAQDRNVLLEEDVEAWIMKKEEMEGEIQRLNDEVEAWKVKAAAAERSMKVVETTAKESAKQIVALETALREAEFQYNEHLQEQERRHTEALLDQKEKITQQMALANDTVAPQNPQELMLQKAVANRKAKDAAAKGSGIWNSVLQRVQTSSVPSDCEDNELSTEQRRIKELESINADQIEEINKQKSEMVKLKSTYNDTLYNNKKKIESLEDENEMYMAKQQAMDFELKELRRELERYRETSSGDTVASF